MVVAFSGPTESFAGQAPKETHIFKITSSIRFRFCNYKYSDIQRIWKSKGSANWDYNSAESADYRHIHL